MIVVTSNANAGKEIEWSFIVIRGHLVVFAEMPRAAFHSYRNVSGLALALMAEAGKS
ncbi:MAG: hypothetical protein KGY69_14110 [Bacteroidales bacterium]|nr:hypothetical protein [Bacteroidales bacterium]